MSDSRWTQRSKLRGEETTVPYECSTAMQTRIYFRLLPQLGAKMLFLPFFTPCGRNLRSCQGFSPGQMAPLCWKRSRHWRHLQNWRSINVPLSQQRVQYFSQLVLTACHRKHIHLWFLPNLTLKVFRLGSERFKRNLKQFKGTHEKYCNGESYNHRTPSKSERGIDSHRIRKIPQNHENVSTIIEL